MKLAVESDIITVMNAPSKKTKDSNCLCGQALAFDDCCGRIHADIGKAKSAESLMRARFSAYCRDDVDFIQQSWHSSTRPNKVDPNDEGFVWQSLEIVDTLAGGPDDEQGEVEFVASYTLNGHDGKLHERSLFAREDGQWRYLDGKLQKGAPVKVTKIGRNEPCPCGSGKKYKRCCM